MDWRWGGTFGETEDGLPYIGTARQFPHGYFALGYGGNGITFSWIAANLLLDRFLERPNDGRGAASGSIGSAAGDRTCAAAR